MLSIERDADNEKNPKQTKELLDDFKPCFWKNYSSLKKIWKSYNFSLHHTDNSFE